MFCMCRIPLKWIIDQFLWSCQQAPPTLLRNQTLIVNPGFQLVRSKKVTILSAVQVQPKTYKRRVLGAKNFILSLVFECQQLLPLHKQSILSGIDYICIHKCILSIMGEQTPKIIDITDDDDDEEDLPEMGLVNITEAEGYIDKITNIFDNLSELLHADHKDAIPTTIRSFWKLIVKHWESMSDADPEVMIWSITDPVGVHLWQCITKGGVDITIPDEEVLMGCDFIQKLPEKQWKKEEIELIIGVFNSTCEAHSHMATVAANLSLLAKVTDKETLKNSNEKCCPNPWSRCTFLKGSWTQ